MKHFVCEREAGVLSTVFALTSGGLPRLRGLLRKFQWKLFPKGAELGWQELEQPSSGQLLEDLGASREKEQQSFLGGTPSSDALQSCRRHSSIPRMLHGGAWFMGYPSVETKAVETVGGADAGE